MALPVGFFVCADCGSPVADRWRVACAGCDRLLGPVYLPAHRCVAGSSPEFPTTIAGVRALVAAAKIAKAGKVK